MECQFPLFLIFPFLLTLFVGRAGTADRWRRSAAPAAAPPPGSGGCSTASTCWGPSPHATLSTMTRSATGRRRRCCGHSWRRLPPPPSALRGCIDGDGGLKHCALEGLRPRRERHSPYRTRRTGSGLLLTPSESAKTNTLLLVSQEWDKSGPNPGGRAALSGLAVLPPTLCGGR